MLFDRDTLPLLDDALDVLERGFASLPDAQPTLDREDMRRVLRDAALRMQDNFPYPHPLYVGQMLKPPHPIARLAYQLAQYINPNNHALDGGRASSRLEREAVERIAAMFGWEAHLGHLCGGGTMANLEALWVSRELRPGRTLLASSQAHYTHSRLSSVLCMPYRSVDVDARGRMDLDALRGELEKGDVGTLVVTLGATATGAVDPLDRIVDLTRDMDVRLHVDAAYGGYFTLAGNLETDARRAFDAVDHADSIVVDPHKHGLQPYGCGCVLFRDPAVGAVYRHDSPYTYFSSDELHLGEISLECSRAGAAAVALWATQELLPYEKGGAFARALESCREAALALHAWLHERDDVTPLLEPELDIVVWAVKAKSASEASARAQQVFDEAAKRGLHLALAAFPRALAEPVLQDLAWDEPTIRCLRACTMKPEHGAWLEAITDRLAEALTTYPALPHRPPRESS